MEMFPGVKCENVSGDHQYALPSFGMTNTQDIIDNAMSKSNSNATRNQLEFCGKEIHTISNYPNRLTTVQSTSILKLNLHPNSPKIQLGVNRLLLKKIIPTKNKRKMESMSSMLVTYSHE